MVLNMRKALPILALSTWAVVVFVPCQLWAEPTSQNLVVVPQKPGMQIPLFEESDYRLMITSWKITPTKEQKIMFTFVLSYEISDNRTYQLSISPLNSTDNGHLPSFLEDASEVTVIRGPTKGLTRTKIEIEAPTSVLFFQLWRGLQYGSPSGIVCDGALVSLALKVTPMMVHPNRQPYREATIQN
jgi:hypothetical protein